MRNDNYENTETAKIEAFAADRMVPEMDAKHSERPAELEGNVVSQLSDVAVSRAASPVGMIEATGG
jgi:hypothetical protein